MSPFRDGQIVKLNAGGRKYICEQSRTGTKDNRAWYIAHLAAYKNLQGKIISVSPYTSYVQWPDGIRVFYHNKNLDVVE